MPDSRSPSAADCRWLEERPGEVSVHARLAFTPVPWHSLLALAGENIGRMDLCGSACLRRRYFGINKGAGCSQDYGVKVGVRCEPHAGAAVAASVGCLTAPRACPAHLPVPAAWRTSPQASPLPCLSSAFDYLLKRFDTG